MRETLLVTQGFLEGMADRLDFLAEQSKTDGWSPEQGKENRKAADDCRRMAETVKARLAAVGRP